MRQAQLGEGTCWSPSTQSLWWVDILDRRLHRYRPADGAKQSWQFDEEISAVAERSGAPGLVITLRRGLATFDPDCRRGCLAAVPAHPRTGARRQPLQRRQVRSRRGASGAARWTSRARLRSGRALPLRPGGARCVRHEVGFCRHQRPDLVAGRNGRCTSTTPRAVSSTRSISIRLRALCPISASGCGWPPVMVCPTAMTTGRRRPHLARALGAVVCVTCHDPLSGAELGGGPIEAAGQPGPPTAASAGPEPAHALHHERTRRPLAGATGTRAARGWAVRNRARSAGACRHRCSAVDGKCQKEFKS